MNAHPLPALRNQLLSLHKILMLAERASYEKEGNVVQGPNHFLQLLTGDARFAWLRELSQLVVMIDEAMEEKPGITTERADALVNEARVLLTGLNEGGKFAARYAAMMKRDPSVAAAHAEISKAFA
jgi:poly(3-hydroxybutyrate) depolymerase